VRRHDGRISVVVELAETQGARIVWTDELEGVADDTFSVLDAIVNRIVAAIAEEIESAECSRALLKPPSSLDAWEAYHRGLWHMYKFNGPDMRDARAVLSVARSTRSDVRPRVCRVVVHAFPEGVPGSPPDRERQISLALETASQSLGAENATPPRTGRWGVPSG